MPCRESLFCTSPKAYGNQKYLGKFSYYFRLEELRNSRHGAKNIPFSKPSDILKLIGFATLLKIGHKVGMCTLVINRRPDHRWPLLIAANRDENTNRAWKAPDRHWPDRPEVVAGMDELAGGTWLGVNDHGVVSAVLNRKNSLGHDPRLRSRGELVLDALDHSDALDATHALLDLEPAAYRSFNLFVADNRDAWWIRSTGPDAPKVDAFEIPEGISMLTSIGLNNHKSLRTKHYLPMFRDAQAPQPDKREWAAWERLMRAKEVPNGAGPEEAMFIPPDSGYGTISSSLIAAEAPNQRKPMVIWRFSAEPNIENSFDTINL